MKRKVIQRPPSARQKMINLMYIVLLAMLAMNVSSDVLNGFKIVEESLSNSTSNATLQNDKAYREFAAADSINHEKVGEWYSKALYVKQISDSLFNYADELKTLIAIQADGKDADVNNIHNREDLEAATQVMLHPSRGQGGKLYDAINSYRDKILEMVTDPTQREIISNNFSTEVPLKVGALGKNWQEYNYENMPVAAAITLLTKLQNDVRYAEGEVLYLSIIFEDGSNNIEPKQDEDLLIYEKDGKIYRIDIYNLKKYVKIRIQGLITLPNYELIAILNGYLGKYDIMLMSKSDSGFSIIKNDKGYFVKVKKDTLVADGSFIKSDRLATYHDLDINEKEEEIKLSNDEVNEDDVDKDFFQMEEREL